MPTMRAIRLHAFGPAENLSYEHTDTPVPTPGQVRIAVAAAGVHLLDTSLRQGIQGPPAPLPELPTVPGREVAGTDAAGGGGDQGDGVRSEVGDRRVIAARYLYGFQGLRDDATHSGYASGLRILAPAGVVAPLRASLSRHFGSLLVVAGLAPYSPACPGK